MLSLNSIHQFFLKFSILEDKLQYFCGKKQTAPYLNDMRVGWGAWRIGSDLEGEPSPGSSPPSHSTLTLKVTHLIKTSQYGRPQKPLPLASLTGWGAAADRCRDWKQSNRGRVKQRSWGMTTNRSACQEPLTPF